MSDFVPTVIKTFIALGIVAAVSLLTALAVMTLIADPPPVVRWFLASAGVAGLSFAAAIAVHWWTQ